MVKYESALLWWIPAIILSCIFIPMSFRWFTVYVEFALPLVGIFAAWFSIRHLFFSANQPNSKQIGIIYLLLVLVYNPVAVEYAFATYVASINHLYLIMLNVLCAAFFVSMWWQVKMKKSTTV